MTMWLGPAQLAPSTSVWINRGAPPSTGTTARLRSGDSRRTELESGENSCAKMNSSVPADVRVQVVAVTVESSCRRQQLTQGPSRSCARNERHLPSGDTVSG